MLYATQRDLIEAARAEAESAPGAAQDGSVGFMAGR
jgi:hypothetical protein